MYDVAWAEKAEDADRLQTQIVRVFAKVRLSMEGCGGVLWCGVV